MVLHITVTFFFIWNKSAKRYWNLDFVSQYGFPYFGSQSDIMHCMKCCLTQINISQDISWVINFTDKVHGRYSAGCPEKKECFYGLSELASQKKNSESHQPRTKSILRGELFGIKNQWKCVALLRIHILSSRNQWHKSRTNSTFCEQLSHHFVYLWK